MEQHEQLKNEGDPAITPSDPSTLAVARSASPDQPTAALQAPIAPSHVPARLIVQDDTEVSHLMDTARFEQAQRVAQTLAMSAFIPEHLKSKTGNPKETAANCFRVVNQAFRWGMDPFALADETYVVQGRIGYQGKLVAAIVNARSGMRGRLSCTFVGAGEDRTITISGQFPNEAEPRTIELSVKQAKTSNKMWTSDPDQKLYYSGVVKWARRHCPEVILGVLTEDDVDKIAESQAENMITGEQWSTIDRMVHTALISEDEKLKIEGEMNNMSREAASRLIGYLRDQQPKNGYQHATEELQAMTGK